MLIDSLLEINHRLISQDDPKTLGFEALRDVVRKYAALTETDKQPE